MVFCSLLAYPLDSFQRKLAERCLWKLLRQLEAEDLLLTFEASFSDRMRAWRMKPKVVAAALTVAKDDEFVCFVDADIDFRDGFVTELKNFLHPLPLDKPTIVATPVWEIGRELIKGVDEEFIEKIRQRSGLLELYWDFYFGTGLFVVNKPFLDFVNEWQDLTERSQFYPEETALVALAHRYKDKLNTVWLPEKLHWIAWHKRGIDEKAMAIHIGSDQLDFWIRTAYGGEP